MMNKFRKIIKKIRKHFFDKSKNLIIVIDPKVVLHPERYYEMIKRSFEETGCFTVHSANCIPLILGNTNYHVIANHFYIGPPWEEYKYGWSDISEIISYWTDNGKFVIKFMVPPHRLQINERNKNNG